MSTFASLKFIKEYKRVVYYSMVVDGEEKDKSLFEIFVGQHTSQNKDK